MLVSNFEILINRITVGNSPFNRKVVQGYFLHITNLETDRELKLNVTVTSAKCTPPGPNLVNGTNINRDFIPDTNAVMVFDNAPTLPNNFDNFGLRLVQTGTNTERQYANVFRTDNMPAIGPNQTALVAIFPITNLFNPNTALEIRGHVKINLVPDANAARPYKVLLSADHRGTFIDEKLIMNMPGPYDFDQVAYSLSLASGKAENVLAD